MRWTLTRAICLATTLAGLLTGAGSLCLIAATEADAAATPPPVRQGENAGFREYELMAGTPFHILLQSPIDTAVSQVGDPIDALLMQNIYLNATLLLSRNTRFQGVITQLHPPVEGRHAILEVRFTEIVLDNGEKLPIAAYVRTGHPERIWGGGVTPGTKPVRSTQRVWGIGEYNRIVMQGPREMGAHIVFDPGEHWTIVLESPVTLVQASR